MGVAFCAGKVDPFFQVQFIGFATGPSAPTGTTRTAPVEASAMDEILSQLNPKGDKITWTSGKAAPHNIVFDEENIPAGVDAKALGQPEGEYLNEEGDTFSQTFSVAGKYNYFCAPHAGAGMQGDITVE